MKFRPRQLEVEAWQDKDHPDFWFVRILDDRVVAMTEKDFHARYEAIEPPKNCLFEFNLGDV